jgi:hypothetical protein
MRRPSHREHLPHMVFEAFPVKRQGVLAQCIPVKQGFMRLEKPHGCL